MPTISSILNGITQNALTYNTSGDSITIYGQANNFTIANGAVLNVLYGGATSGTNVQAQSIENVYTYGSATATVVNNGGIQNVVDNGSTTSTIVNNGGLQKIHDNASAYVTILNSGGVQSIYNGGSAFYTTVHSGGYITTTQNGVSFQPYIESNGYEDVGYNRITHLSNVGSSVSAQLYGGSQYVYSGSIASATTIFNGGSSYILAGASAANTIVNSGGFQLVTGSTTSTILNDSGVLNVIYGGITSHTNVKGKSAENVFNQGSATATIVSDNGAQNVYDNGSTTSTIVNNSASQNIYNDASAYVTVLNSGGVQNIYDGGSAFYTTVHSGGYVAAIQKGVSFQAYIESGGYEDIGYNKITNSSGTGSSVSAQLYGGSQYVYSGSVESAATIFNGGASYILTGGSAVSTIIYSGGSQSVNGVNAIASNTTLSNTAILNVENGAITSGTTIQTSSVENVLGNGSAISTLVNSGGSQVISGSTNSFGSATGTVIQGGGQQTIYDWGRAGGITLSGGTINVSAGGGINDNVNFASGGTINVYSGAGVSTQITSGGKEYIYSGGIANNTLVDNASQVVLNGGQINSTTISDNGTVDVSAGGIASNVIVNSAGILRISSGTVNTITVNNNGITVVNGGTVNNNTVQYGGIFNITDGVLGDTTVNSGGAILISIDTVDIEGNVSIKTGAFINNREALQDITINGASRMNLTTLLNDPTLFATTDASKAIVDKTATNKEATVNLDTNKTQSSSSSVNTNKKTNSLKDLLNNPNYFAPVTVTPQATSLQTRDFVAPETTALYETPTTYSDDTSTDAQTTSSQTSDVVTPTTGDDTSTAAQDLNITKASDGTITFTPPGHAPISGIMTSLALQGNSISGLVQTGPTLVYGDGYVPTIPGMTYNQYPLYIAEDATVNLVTPVNLTDVYVYNTATLNVSKGSISNLYVDNGGYVSVNGGTISSSTIADGGILDATSGTLTNTHIKSGGSLIVATNTTTLTGQFQMDAGAYYNNQMALQDISVNLTGEQNLATLLNDPTLFTSTNSSSLVNLDTDTTQSSSNSVNTDKDTNSSQVTSIETRDFVAPETLSVTTTDYPTTDGSGNPITDVTPVTDTTTSTELQVWTYKLASGYSRTSFVPPGHADTDRIWGIQFYSASDSGVTSTVASLIAGTGSYGRLTSATYAKPVYAAEGATITTEQNFTNVSNVYIYDNATLQATQGAINNLYVDDGGTANFSNTATVGTLTLESGGKANITTSTGGIISLEGTDNTGLVISGKASAGGTTVASTIDNFDGNDSITLEDIQRSDVAGVTFGDADHITITLNDGSSITLNIPGIESTGYTLGENSAGNVVFETCFLTGTLIAMLSGMTTVENIQVGEIIETFDWKTNQTINTPVIWVGHKHMTVKTYLPDDLAGYPVRVLKNAISENVPNEDLLITPEHCLFFNGNFIPARMLVNGRSVYYDRSITSYDYYHIETEAHSVIWANNTLTETYLDTGNRNTFENNHKVISLFNQAKSWDQDGAAPLNVQRHVVEPIYNQLNNNAIDKNLELKTEELSLTNNPEFCLMTECGTIIPAHSINNGRYIFPIPEDIHTVQLCSRTYRPNETIGAFIDDRRELGILVGSILIIGHNVFHAITDHLSNPDLKGWDAIEESSCRWTNGQATLNIHQNHSQKRVLIVNILAAGPYINKNNREEVVVEKIAS